MNTQAFQQAVKDLSTEDLQALLEGAALKLDNDETLTLGRQDDAFVIFVRSDEDFSTPESVREHLLSNAEALIKEYYQFNPLSKTSFNRQLLKLIQDHDMDYFVQQPKQPAKGRIFVEADTLVNEPKDSPRFKYGMALELDESPATAEALKNKVNNWVHSGQAYSDYISTNVCRFSCVD